MKWYTFEVASEEHARQLDQSYSTYLRAYDKAVKSGEAEDMRAMGDAWDAYVAALGLYAMDDGQA